MPESSAEGLKARVRRLFDEIVPLAPARRRLRLEALRSESPEVHREVCSLLEAHEAVDEILAPLGRIRLGDTATCPPGAERRDDTDHSGTRISHYQLLSRIGAGGMGTVYRALDVTLQRIVALKLFPAAVAFDPRRKARLLQEARAASNLDHPAVCTVYEIDETADGTPFLVMAYCEGESLRQRLSRERMSREEALRTAAEIAGGLECAHAAGVIHRDIKPENLILPSRGGVKIVDFGLAKMAGIDLTSEQERFGTAAYMSPEQIQGEAIGEATDIWSLGVVLHEMLTGERPFGGDSIPAILHAVLNAEPPAPPPELLEGGLDQILRRSLAKNPADRFSSVSALRQALEAVLSSGRSIGGRQATAGAVGELADLTSFVGRDRECREVGALLDDHRLVTLTGAAGTGKTRLARRVASEMVGTFPDGAVFVPLASVTDSERIASRIATAIGFGESPGRATEEQIVVELRRRRMLLVLDNYEHLLAASALPVALLSGCPLLKILVTSRAPLRVGPEQQYEVHPLDVPEVDQVTSREDLRRYPATELFLQRARAVRHRWNPDGEEARSIAEICRRVDGLPLAIELAAARIKLLSPQALLDRLGSRLDLLHGRAADLPDRHRALREAIAWSYNLLGPEEQALFRLLGVFAGPFALESAEAVCRQWAECTVDPAEGIEALLDHSLLRRVDGRRSTQDMFLMLETIREFAVESVRGAGEEEALHAQHAAAYLSLAERAEPELTGPRQAVWVERLEAEADNLNAAIDRSVSSGQSETALRLGASVWRYWAIRGLLREGRKMLKRLLALPAGGERTLSRARALNAIGSIGHEVGHFTEARRLFDESLAIFEELGDDVGRATSLNNIGWVLLNLGDLEGARKLAEEVLHFSAEQKLRRAEAVAWNNLAWIHLVEGKFEEAIDVEERNRAIRDELGDSRGLAFALGGRSWAEQMLGRFDQANESSMEALEILERIGERQILGFVLLMRGRTHLLQGSISEARRVLDDATERWRAAGNRYGLVSSLSWLALAELEEGSVSGAASLLGEATEVRDVDALPHFHAELVLSRACYALARGNDREAGLLVAECLRAAIRRGYRHLLVRGLELGAVTLSKRGRWTEVARTFAAARQARRTFQIPVSPLEERQLQQLGRGGADGENAGLAADAAPGDAWTQGDSVVEWLLEA